MMLNVLYGTWIVHFTPKPPRFSSVSALVNLSYPILSYLIRKLGVQSKPLNARNLSKLVIDSGAVGAVAFGVNFNAEHALLSPCTKNAFHEHL